MTTGYFIPHCKNCNKELSCLDEDDVYCNKCRKKIDNKVKELKKPKFNK